MIKIKNRTIETILKLLRGFLKGDKFLKSEDYYLDPSVYHYYNEIIRYWSNLNFIVKKTLRSLNYSREIDNNVMGIYLYATYRITHEKASIETVLAELNSKKEYLLFFKRLSSFLWKEALRGKSEQEILSIKEAIPTFVINHLKPVMKFDFLKDNLLYMNNIRKDGESYFKINPLAIEDKNEGLRKLIQENLQILGINLIEDRDIPDLYRIPFEDKRKIIEQEWYNKGYILFQDKGSVAVVMILKPRSEDKILDISAAPGIKTTLIAQESNNKARILANDFNMSRLKQSIEIFNKFFVSNCFLLNSDSINIPLRREVYFDRVLIDAPCTGSGTFLAHPELKWRQNDDFLRQNTFLQRNLIRKGIDLLKPKGTLVYSTCSLYPEEGELQILKFLDELEPLKMPKWFYPSYNINSLELKGTGRLFPSIHHTQGFFIGNFKKKEL